MGFVLAKTPIKRSPIYSWIGNAFSVGLLWLALTLPYSVRVPMLGWIMARVISPLAGGPVRIRKNLALTMPDLPEAQVKRLIRQVPDNTGRALIEIYSGLEFINHIKDIIPSGPGLPALETAKASKQPVILVTGHFGNYDAPRGWLMAHGFPVGGLYNPMKNKYFNEHYVKAISVIGLPVFSRGREGLSGMLRFIKGGGMIGMVIDQHMGNGVQLPFFGKPAMTALSAAELGLKYNALVVPIYGIRQPDGLSFDIRIESPIPHSDPETMTQALNDSLENLVRQHMDQWLWTHRRWKGGA
jgi:Kdo2-lipid IVA lauroyltransferase/acyltransferase